MAYYAEIHTDTHTQINFVITLKINLYFNWQRCCRDYSPASADAVANTEATTIIAHPTKTFIFSSLLTSVYYSKFIYLQK